MLRHVRFFPPALFLCLLVYSCGSGDNGIKGDSISSKVDTIKDSVHVKYAHLIRNIPVPFDILDKLREAKLPYKKELLNDLNKESQYAKSNAQALNLGIYGADLAYTGTLGELSDAPPHIRVVKKMADLIVVPTAFDEATIKKYQDSGVNRDSLRSMMYTSYSRIDQTLQDNDRVSLATLVVTGGWIECLYLTTQHINNQPKNDQNKLLYTILGDQRQHLSNLVRLLDDFKTDAFISDLAYDLRDLEKAYPTDNNFSADAIKTLTDKVTALRTKAVNAQ